MKIADMKDAKKDHEFNMVLIDCANITRRSLNNCVNIHSLMRCDKSIKQAKVCKTMTYILFDEDKVPTRFQNTSLVKEVVRINDQEGKAGLVKLLSKNGGQLALKLAKPRPQIRLKNLRSDAMRAARKKSRRTPASPGSYPAQAPVAPRQIAQQTAPQHRPQPARAKRIDCFSSRLPR